jgi:toxin ParE1/3/4
VKVEYSKRAIADLRQIAAYFAGLGAPTVGERINERIQEVVARIAGWPFSGRPIAQRPGVRFVPLLAYRYKIFYHVTGDTIRIVHIRHTSRRPFD